MRWVPTESWNHTIVLRATGCRVKAISPSAKPPVLCHQWPRSVFHWYDQLASVIIPPMGPKNVMGHTESLTNNTQKSSMWHCRWYFITKFRSKDDEEAILQNWKALDILMAAPGGTCAIIKTECCACIPENFANVSSAIQNLYSENGPTLNH